MSQNKVVPLNIPFAPPASRILAPLAVVCALTLSACSRSPTHGALLESAPPKPIDSSEQKKKDASPAPNQKAAPTPALSLKPERPQYPIPNPFEPSPPTQPLNIPFLPAPPKLPSTPASPSPRPSFNPTKYLPPPAPASTTSVAPKTPPVLKPLYPSAPTTPVGKPPAEQKIGPKFDAPKPVAAPIPPSKPIEPPTDLLSILSRAYGQSIGVYDRGRLEKPDSIPTEGEGFLKVFQERERSFASLDLVSMIESAAKEIHRDLPATETLQIGDLSDKNGGPLGGHGSHQNGLDADIAYFNTERSVMSSTGKLPGATGFAKDYVDRKGNVSSSFDIETNWRFIEILVSTGRVDRIFADQNIKRTFCEYAISKGKRADWSETLRKLRHWAGHQDHMHVRITCPANSLKCKPTPEIPAGDGCDSLLRNRSRRNGILQIDGQFFSPEHSPEEASPVDPNEHGC